jgi:hypothetical protein
MLASLLAKQPSQTQIPPIPASVLTATPNEKLPKVETASTGMLIQTSFSFHNLQFLLSIVGVGVGRGNMGPRGHQSDVIRGHQPNIAATSTSHHHHNPHVAAHPHSINQQQQQPQPPKQSPNNPPSVVTPQPPQGPSQPNVAMPLEGTAGPGGRLESPADSSSVLAAGSTSSNLLSSTGSLSGDWASSSSNNATSTNDEMLSDILDQVIEFVPDSMNTGELKPFLPK